MGFGETLKQCLNLRIETLHEGEMLMLPADKGILVWIALLGVLFAITLAAIVIQRAGDQVDLETRKIRFAAATFTGLMLLFIFTAVLYFADDDSDRGKEIFEKAFTAMSPLAGAIIGYLFGSRTPRSESSATSSN